VSEQIPQYCSHYCNALITLIFISACKQSANIVLRRWLSVLIWRRLNFFTWFVVRPTFHCSAISLCNLFLR